MNALQIDSSSASGRFSKERRVRRRSEFQQVFAQGTRLHGRYFTVVLLASDHDAPRLGLVASRKFGGSVERNRAKRLIREMFRLQLPSASGLGADFVVIPKRGMLDAPFAAVSEDFQNIWRRARERVAKAERERVANPKK